VPARQFAKLRRLQSSKTNHYATLGLDRKCTTEQVRTAYRLLAKAFHPDLNQGSREAVARTQALNAAEEILSDPERRQAYDRELATAEKAPRSRASKTERNIAKDVHLRIDEFLRGTTREVHINDPGNPDGPELYELIIPAATAVGTRLRLQRAGGGHVAIRVRALPGFQFKVRGADLRCDLKINLRRATQGGEEMVTGVTGTQVRVKIQPGVARGEIVRIVGEGLPRPRGGRGDLLVRITYRLEVHIIRKSGR
jgi:curved DNA-binding protein